MVGDQSDSASAPPSRSVSGISGSWKSFEDSISDSDVAALQNAALNSLRSGSSMRSLSMQSDDSDSSREYSIERLNEQSLPEELQTKINNTMDKVINNQELNEAFSDYTTTPDNTRRAKLFSIIEKSLQPPKSRGKALFEEAKQTESLTSEDAKNIKTVALYYRILATFRKMWSSTGENKEHVPVVSENDVEDIPNTVQNSIIGRFKEKLNGILKRIRPTSELSLPTNTELVGFQLPNYLKQYTNLSKTEEKALLDEIKTEIEAEAINTSATKLALLLLGLKLAAANKSPPVPPNPLYLRPPNEESTKLALLLLGLKLANPTRQEPEQQHLSLPLNPDSTKIALLLLGLKLAKSPSQNLQQTTAPTPQPLGPMSLITPQKLAILLLGLKIATWPNSPQPPLPPPSPQSPSSSLSPLQPPPKSTSPPPPSTPQSPQPPSSVAAIPTKLHNIFSLLSKRLNTAAKIVEEQEKAKLAEEKAEPTLPGAQPLEASQSVLGQPAAQGRRGFWPWQRRPPVPPQGTPGPVEPNTQPGQPQIGTPMQNGWSQSPYGQPVQQWPQQGYPQPVQQGVPLSQLPRPSPVPPAAPPNVQQPPAAFPASPVPGPSAAPNAIGTAPAPAATRSPISLQSQIDAEYSGLFNDMFPAGLSSEYKNAQELHLKLAELYADMIEPDYGK